MYARFDPKSRFICARTAKCAASEHGPSGSRELPGRDNSHIHEVEIVR
jgi:hypothetical protein